MIAERLAGADVVSWHDTGARHRCIEQRHRRDAMLAIEVANRDHDVSGHRGTRGKVAVIRQAPPQHGQMLGSKCSRPGRGAMITGPAGASGGDSSYSCRIRSSLARRIPLARKS